MTAKGIGSMNTPLTGASTVLTSPILAQAAAPFWLFLGAALVAQLALLASPRDARAQAATRPATRPIETGQRVFTCGHSFHVFVPAILADIADKAGIQGHKQVGLSSIGGSVVLQHWNVPDETNAAKKALRTGAVDVLTLSPIYLPDAGLDHFTQLAVEHNPAIRILVQPIWLRREIDEQRMERPAHVDHDAVPIAELRRRHARLLGSVDDYVAQANAKLGRSVLFVVPAPQAILALREKIAAGEVPGIQKQAQLFTDETCHLGPVTRALVAYCNFAVLYRRSPVGLPVPNELKAAGLGEHEASINLLLQQLAWDAVTHHPLSGVPAEVKP